MARHYPLTEVIPVGFCEVVNNGFLPLIRFVNTFPPPIYLTGFIHGSGDPVELSLPSG